MLLWAEKRPKAISEEDEKEVANETSLEGDKGVEIVSHVLFEAIKAIIADSLLSWARACGDGRGLELWRCLHALWRTSAPQVVAAQVGRYQDTARCPTNCRSGNSWARNSNAPTSACPSASELTQ